jgi:hypothetical protein
VSENEKAPGDAPRPEPIRFFGTTWVDHDGGYGWRRAAVAVGSLIATAAGAFLLRFAYEGFADADVGTLLKLLFVLALAICTALAFRRTWQGLTSSTAEPAPEGRALLLIGFVGSLFAYFLRSLTEAPGEQARRAEYERARDAHERRRTARTGNPATRTSDGKKRKRR